MGVVNATTLSPGPSSASTITSTITAAAVAATTSSHPSSSSPSSSTGSSISSTSSISIDSTISSSSSSSGGGGGGSSSSSGTSSSYTTVVASTVSNLTSSLLPSELTSAASTTTRHLYNESVETYTHSLQPESVGRSTATWNISRVGEAFPKAATSATTSLCTTTMSSTSTEDPFDEFGPPEGVEYIFVPLGVMIFVIVLSAVVIIISRKRKLERLRHRLMPLYNFDPGEEGEDDWETELLDEGFSSRQRRQGYQSMDSEENTELFSPAHTQNLG